MASAFSDLFSVRCPVIGMIHVQALPGTPSYRDNFAGIVAQAMEEAKLYTAAGVDAILMENMHDLPYLNREVGHEISTSMAVVAAAVKSVSDLPCGMQILAGANKAALAAAHAAGLQFIRAEGFVFGHVADEGWMNSDAGELLRYRKQIGAEDILVITDLKKKHSAHALTADVSLAETAHAAQFFHSNGLIVTGNATGNPASIEDLKGMRSATDLPILVGSGINLDNLPEFFPWCDGMIIGSWFKENGDWTRSPDESRVRAFTKAIAQLRAQLTEIP
jgi:hypothetical protein